MLALKSFLKRVVDSKIKMVPFVHSKTAMALVVIQSILRLEVVSLRISKAFVELRIYLMAVDC